jgi:endonuclease YncB( thermonuclease family)
LIRFVFLFLLACSVQAETLTGRVVGVADGDTITVLDANRQQHKIRLAGIDAPEKAQPFGDRSKQNLSALVFDKQVVVESNKQDRYGRTVGKVLVNEIDANLAQVKAGMAWWYEVDQQCPCLGTARCTGPKGGRYCLTAGGGKKYQ